MTPGENDTSDTVSERLDKIAAELQARRISIARFAEYVELHHGLALSKKTRKALSGGAYRKLDCQALEHLSELVVTLPEAPRVTGKGSKLGLLTITPTMRKELNTRFETTGISPALLVRRRPEELPTLTVNKVSNWRTGRVSKADPAEWRYIVDALCGIGAIALSQKDKI